MPLAPISPTSALLPSSQKGNPAVFPTADTATEQSTVSQWNEALTAAQQRNTGSKFSRPSVSDAESHATRAYTETTSNSGNELDTGSAVSPSVASTPSKASASVIAPGFNTQNDRKHHKIQATVAVAVVAPTATADASRSVQPSRAGSSTSGATSISTEGSRTGADAIHSKIQTADLRLSTSPVRSRDASSTTSLPSRQAETPTVQSAAPAPPSAGDRRAQPSDTTPSTKMAAPTAILPSPAPSGSPASGATAPVIPSSFLQTAAASPNTDVLDIPPAGAEKTKATARSSKPDARPPASQDLSAESASILSNVDHLSKAALQPGIVESSTVISAKQPIAGHGNQQASLTMADAHGAFAQLISASNTLSREASSGNGEAANIAAQIIPKIIPAITSGGSVKISLHPESLGPLSVNLTRDASGNLHILFAPATAAGAAAVNGSLHLLQSQLVQSGVSVTSFQVVQQDSANASGFSSGQSPGNPNPHLPRQAPGSGLFTQTADDPTPAVNEGVMAYA